ncbi:TPA: hypothetical protein ACXE9F_001444 [Pluralibacter gergoviae]
MLIGALILTVIGLSISIMAGYLAAENLSPLPALLGVISVVFIIGALALAHGPVATNSVQSPYINQEVPQ